MKVALYNWDGSVQVWEANDYRENDKSMVRTTEITDVEFVDLPRSEVVPKQVAKLEEQKTETRIAFQAAINLLDDKISRLLAIENGASND